MVDVKSDPVVIIPPTTGISVVIPVGIFPGMDVMVETDPSALVVGIKTTVSDAVPVADPIVDVKSDPVVMIPPTTGMTVVTAPAIPPSVAVAAAVSVLPDPVRSDGVTTAPVVAAAGAGPTGRVVVTTLPAESVVATTAGSFEEDATNPERVDDAAAAEAIRELSRALVAGGPRMAAQTTFPAVMTWSASAVDGQDSFEQSLIPYRKSRWLQRQT